MQHFRVAYRFSGLRREVFVHVYPTVEELREAAKLYGDDDFSTIDGLFSGFNYRFSEGETEANGVQASGVVLLHADRLTVEVIAHEMTHAAMHQFFTVNPRSPEEPVGDFMVGNNEAVAYFVGEWTANAINELKRRGYEVGVS